uniref:Uncharacterized protein n=1 Tax=Trichuris muris TaxID=70415 RepID=A0A5S6QWW0_TRIMR
MEEPTQPYLLIDSNLRLPVAIGFNYPLFRNGDNSRKNGRAVYTVAHVLVPGYTTIEGVKLRKHRNVFWKDDDCITLPFSSLAQFLKGLPTYQQMMSVHTLDLD